MLILKIASNTHNSDRILEEAGIEIKYVTPSRFSFLTSMRIATFLKHDNPDAIFVFRPNDLIATESALKLNVTSHDFKDNSSQVKPVAKKTAVIFYIEHTLKKPRSLNPAILRAADLLVFDSKETSEEWKEMCAKCGNAKTEIVSPTLQITKLHKSQNQRTQTGDNGNHTPVLTYCGPIGDGKRLSSVLTAIASEPEERQPQVRILGTGKARIVMPIVNKAKHNRLDTVWLGEEFELEEELNLAEGFIQSGPTYTAVELRLMGGGMPAVTFESLNDWLTEEKRAKMKEKTLNLYDTEYSPEIFVEKIKNLIARFT